MDATHAPPLSFCAAAPASTAEDRADRERMKHLKREIEHGDLAKKPTLHIEDAARCRDRWRVPLTYDCDHVRVGFSDFARVRCLGASLVVEEAYDDGLGDAPPNAYYVEFRRTRLSGFRQMSCAGKTLFIALVLATGACAFAASLHVAPYFVGDGLP